MKSWLLLSFLLLSVLIHEAEGIRLMKGSISDNQHNIHGEKSGEVMKHGSVEEVILCKGKHCSSGRINRKLTMNPNYEQNKAQSKLEGSSINKNKRKKEENLSVNPSSITEQPQPVPEPFPDIVDIAGMDYSQARRKPPIHN